MEEYELKRIGDYRLAVETATAMLEDLESTYSCAMRGFGNKVNACQVPDSRLISITDRRDKLRSQLELDIRKYQDAMQACLDEFNKIDDAELKKILYLRYCMRMSWKDVSKEMGQEKNSAALRKRAERYFQKCREEALRKRPV